MKEYIVVVKPGEDLTTLDSEMSANTGSGAVPNRAVECCDACPQDTRMTHWKLTDEEAKTLEGDARILAVELPYDDNPYIERKPHAWQGGTFNKADTNDGVNWGLSRCSSQINNFEGNSSIFDNYKYAMTGEGVDFVVFDTGIEVNHPEFQDASGGLRVMQLDWFANHSGVTNPYAASAPAKNVTDPTSGFYTDLDGHGTHVAGIAAGKTYGWAKNAHIYSIKMLSSGGPDSISDTLGMDLIRFWHENKGNNRPTIVNMSYGYSWNIDGWTGAAAGDTGQHWDTFTNQMDVWNFGDPNFADKYQVNWEVDVSSVYNMSARSAAVDAKLDQLVAAGVHVTIAGGNGADVQYNYSDDANDNYNDFMSRPSVLSGQPIYYHRGSSPRASTVKGAEMVVTNIGVELENNKEVLAASSACGEAMDINAPGTNITSSCSTTHAMGGSAADYPPDPNYKIANISGTSMAAPQVCGVACLYLQADPTLTPAELKAKILHDAKTGLLHDTAWDQKDLGKYKYIEEGGSGGLRPDRGLFGALNIVLYNRYVGDVFVRYVAAGGGG